MHPRFLVSTLRVLALALVAIVLVPWHPFAQTSASTPATDASQPEPEPQRPDGGRRAMQRAEDEIREQMLRENAKKWNKERQAKLKADTDKLLQLSTELKQQVDKSNENILSLDVIKKAEEIEKLAKNVRERMKADNN